MKGYALVNSGFEDISKKEIKELVGKSGLSFDLEKEEVVKLFQYNQSLRRIIIAIDNNFKDFFVKGLTFKIEVENVKGQENRLEIARKIIPGLVEEMERELDFTPKINVKNPDVLIVVDGPEQLMGIDLGGELNVREFRVFPHAASFKGDLAYYFVCEVGFKSGEKLLCGFMKDGAIALEAGLFANKIAVRDVDVLKKFPLFKDVEVSEKRGNTKVYAFDEGMQNVTATRKNVKIAGVEELFEINKYSLDDLDVKYDQGFFDKAIIQVTRKDEGKLNEIYYQFSYILKKKGRLLMIGRKNWEVSISDKFKLISKKDVQRGESVHRLWLLEKK